MRKAIACALAAALLAFAPAAALAEDAGSDTRTEALDVAQEGDNTIDIAEKIRRLSGEDAYGTMAEAVGEGWESSEAVVIAAFDGYWDALAASALAGSEGAPVLLTGRDSLAPQTRGLIERLGAKRAYVCGGTAAVSEGVEAEVAAMGLSVERLDGAMAYNTAEKISAKARENLGDACDTCVVATIDGFYDSLSAAPAAYALGMPVYLTGFDKALEGSTVDAIRAAGYKKAVIVGGEAAVLPGVVNQLGEAGIAEGDVARLAGGNAWQTSEVIAEWGLEHGLSAETVGVADGNGYWDALTGAPLVGHERGSLVLVPHDDPSGWPTYDPYCIENFVEDNALRIDLVYIFGGEAAVTPTAYNDIVKALKVRVLDYVERAVDRKVEALGADEG